MNRRSIVLPALLVVLGLGAAPACFNSDQGLSALQSDPNAVAATLRIEEVSNGFGRLLPYVVHAVVNGVVSPTQLVEIRTLDDLLTNRPSAANPVLPVATWASTAINPAGTKGNHFVAVRFSRTLSVNSILDPTAGGQANNGLTGAITVVAYDPATGFSEQIQGRGFINGATYFGNPPVLERWVKPVGQNGVEALPVDRNGVAVDPAPGVGYPGTDDPSNGIFDGSFPAAGKNVAVTTFVFVVDSDQDLTTYETFPTGRIIRVVINDSVTDTSGRTLEDAGVATSVVGNDSEGPVQQVDGPSGRPVTFPLDLASGVPCDVGTTEGIHWSFDEACQPYSIGPLPATVPPSLSNEFSVEFQPPVAIGQPPPGQLIKLPYTAMPISPYDFTEFRIRPVVAFPGSDPLGATTQVFITFFHNAPIDLFLNGDPNNLDSTQITFGTGDCPGLVNVPVAPGALFVASNGGGDTGGIRVIDLDGFGQGTGNPTFDDTNPLYNVTLDADNVPIDGDISKFPFNPNLNEPDIFPPLTRDTTTLAGGSRGVFQLAQDSTLGTQLVSTDVVGTVADMMLGQPLDLLFNNFSCLSGGQNACAQSVFQVHPLNGNQQALGNSISHAPHPNPPRFRLSPSCFAPLIQTEEPSYGDGNRDGTLATNRLGPGDAFGVNGGLPPSGLLTNANWYAGFYGPSPTGQFCPTFTLRQQVGHILYVLDTLGDKVVALNSNRMTVIDEIPVSDPRDMAISPDVNVLAVSNKGTNTVTFIDTDPRSPTFHQVIKTSALLDTINNRQGLGPTEIVWQPDDEDILVVCELSNSMAILSAGSLEVRKIIPGVAQPRLLAVSNRDTALGFATGLYYGYVIAADGQMTIFESGPDGIQGIGFDDFVGIPSLPGQSGFDGASAIQPDPNSLFHGMFIAHRNGSQGAIADLHLQNAPQGSRLIVQNSFLPDPNFRSKEWRVNRLFSGVFSSSAIVDIAVDDLNNVGGTSQATSTFGNPKIIQHSSKSLVRTGLASGVSTPRFLFAANSNGRVDVINLSSGQPFVPAILVPGAQVLCHYWRQ